VIERAAENHVAVIAANRTDSPVAAGSRIISGARYPTRQHWKMRFPESTRLRHGVEESLVTAIDLGAMAQKLVAYKTTSWPTEPEHYAPSCLSTCCTKSFMGRERRRDDMKTACKILGLFLVSALALASGESSAQGYPSKPIKFVTGNAAGGGTDILARGIAPKLSERLGQTVLVENRPGADGIIASEYVVKSAPDGYTLLVGADGQMVLNRVLYAKLPYDPVKDFAPIGRLSATPLVIAVHPSVPATSIAELIALAKAKPGELFYASGAGARGNRE
jgi:hypothetical protein